MTGLDWTIYSSIRVFCDICSLLLFPLQCAKSVLLNKIVSSDKDMVGIVFFGTVS